jgi:hypothetical protein
MRRPPLLVLLLLAAPGAATPSAAAPAPRFRSLQFGVDVRQQVPKCATKAPPAKACWQPPPGCVGKDCDAAWAVTFGDSLSDLFFDVRVYQVADKLAALTSAFRTADFAHLSALFRAKYGRAVIAREQPWVSAKGERGTAQRQVWKWQGLSIELRAPADDAATGKLLVATRAYIEAQKQDESLTFQKQLDAL